MKIACYLASALFLLFGALQFNDGSQYANHDFWFWIVLYFATALLSFWLTRRHLPRWIFSNLSGFCLGSALFRTQDHAGNFDFTAPFRATAIPAHMSVETQIPNEVGGLLLVAAWSAFLAWRSWRLSAGPPLA